MNSSNKEVHFGKNGRKKLIGGMKTLAEAVGSTLGPMGRNVIIEREYSTPIITKDGVTVAKEIDFKDPVANMGAQLLKQAASKTADLAGDGTTTSTVLAYNMISEISKNDGSFNPVEVKRGMDYALSNALNVIKNISKPVTGITDIENIAIISANGDTNLGKLIATALHKVGKEGVVVLEQSKTSDDRMETVEGMQFDRGFISPYFANTEASDMAVLDDPYIFITDKKINTVKEILDLLNKVNMENKSILIVAEDFSDEVLAMLLVNKSRGLIRCVAVKAPEFGERREKILQDLACITNGKVISEKFGLKLETAKLIDLGQAKKVTVTRDKTTIIDGNGSTQDIQARLTSIKKEIETAKSDYDKQKSQERLAKIVGGIVILHIGAQTELELKEKMDRADDALRATKAAVLEGIVPGGGSALYHALKTVDMDILHSDDFRFGAKVVLNACASPMEVIAKNAGLNSNDVCNIMNVEDTSIKVYDVTLKKVVDMNYGIIDPTMVVKIALENAVSIASTIMLSNSIVSIIPKEETPKTGQQELLYD